MRALPAPAVASSRHKSDWDEPDSVGPDRPPSPVPAAPPARSLPSVLRQFCVSFCSSSSAPSVATERLRIQLVNRSQIRGPLHRSLHQTRVSNAMALHLLCVRI